MGAQLRRHVDPDGGAICTYRMSNPREYGVVEFDGSSTRCPSRPERPSRTTRCPVPTHFYDNDVVEIARNLKPSARGEYEISDVNRAYRGWQAQVESSRGTAWLDTGTFDSLADATAFVRTVESPPGYEDRRRPRRGRVAHGLNERRGPAPAPSLVKSVTALTCSSCLSERVAE